MSEHKFRCDDVIHHIGKKGEEWKYKYSTEGTEDAQKFIVQITTNDPYSVKDDTGFPTEKGDTVIVKTGKIEAQTGLNVE